MEQAIEPIKHEKHGYKTILNSSKYGQDEK